MSERLRKLGYILRRNQTDAWGRTWAYRTSPADGSGPTNYFRTLEDVGRYAGQVEQIREWQR